MIAAYALLWIPYATALALFVAEVTGRLKAAKAATNTGLPALWIGALVLTYTIQLLIVRYGATHAVPLQPWRLQMPLPTVFIYSVNSDAIEALLLLCGAIQTYALAVIYLSRPSGRLVACGCLAIVTLSIAEPALTSADVYSDVGFALLDGVRAYAPPAQPFQHEFKFISDWANLAWGVPMVPAPYGPLWLAVDKVVSSVAAGLYGKLLALRVFGACCFLLLALLLRVIGFPRRFGALILLNPALAMQFIANAHNDVFALVLIFAGAVFARRQPLLTGAFLTAAGLVKISYAVLGLPILLAVKSRWNRAILALGVVVLTAAISWMAAGSPYVAALEYHAAPMRANAVWHVTATVLALVLIVAAILGSRRYRTAVWLLPPVGGFFPAFIFPWYLAWGIPYALARRNVLGYLLVWYPFASILVDQQAIRLWTLLLVFPTVALFSIRLGPRSKEAPARSTSVPAR